MSILIPTKVENTKALVGATPADADVALWKDGNIGLGIGTDSSVWMMAKVGTSVRYVALIGVPA